MAFEATKRELGELYTFFRLLADGKVSLGTPQVRKDETKCWPVALIQREEHDGTRRYYIEQGNVRIVSGAIEKEGTFVAADKEEQVIPREDFGGAAEFILELLKTTSGTDAIEVPEGLEAFLDAVNIYDLGLIYEIDYEPDGVANIRMTLTAPNCPMADMLVEDVNQQVAKVKGVKSVNVILTFDPVWDLSLIHI